MMKKEYLLAAALFAGAVPTGHAACLPDAAELGDAGPGSDLICDVLDARYPQAEIVILDRQILSPDAVIVQLEMAGRPEEIAYRLVGARWQLEEATIAGM